MNGGILVGAVRFGVIGTSWITEDFIRCASLHKNFKLSAVYSRSAEKAQAFADKCGAAHIFTELEEMAGSDLIDAVYIASPNALHAAQSILCLKHHKHVLCEKSASANVREMRAIIAAAKENNVAFMEAMKTTVQPAMQAIQDNLGKLGKIRRYFGNYCQYSSRYDAHKAGEYNNTFNPAFANGALMDLGVYCIYPMVYLFGKPEKILANATMLPSGVDGETAMLCKYPEMDAVVMFSKITASTAPSEIQGEAGTLRIHTINRMEELSIRYNDKTMPEEKLAFELIDETMYDEVKDFIEMVQQGRIESAKNTFQLALEVREVMDEVRRQIGLRFPNDEN